MKENSRNRGSLGGEMRMRVKEHCRGKSNHTKSNYMHAGGANIVGILQNRLASTAPLPLLAILGIILLLGIILDRLAIALQRTSEFLAQRHDTQAAQVLLPDSIVIDIPTLALRDIAYNSLVAMRKQPAVSNI